MRGFSSTTTSEYLSSQTMNVFVIPSYYPSAEFPIMGIFCREQAIALGTWRPKWNVVISCWGQGGSFELLFKHTHKWPKRLFQFFKQPCHHIKKLLPNVIEVHTPTVRWGERVVSSQDYFKKILDINRKHLLEAAHKFGPINMIHAHVCQDAGMIAEQLSKEFSIPYVITEHTGPFPTSSYLGEDKKLKPEIQKAFDGAQAVVAMSPYQAEALGPWNKNVYLVPNCVDMEAFNLSFTPSTAPFFTLASQLSPSKGINDLLSAIHLAKTKIHHFPEGHFRIGGPGPIADYIKMAKRLEISKEIQWLGMISREQTISEFQSCGCFVLPSHQESFGMVFIEALACGKPVIATNCGGGEFIIEKDQGILVDPKKPHDLAEALISIYLQKTNFFPKTIRERVKERFSSEVFADNTEKVYRLESVKY